MDGCIAKMAATAAMTGEDKCSHMLMYNASVTAIPVFNIRAPNVTASSPPHFESAI